MTVEERDGVYSCDSNFLQRCLFGFDGETFLVDRGGEPGGG